MRAATAFAFLAVGLALLAGHADAGAKKARPPPAKKAVRSKPPPKAKAKQVQSPPPATPAIASPPPPGRKPAPPLPSPGANGAVRNPDRQAFKITIRTASGFAVDVSREGPCLACPCGALSRGQKTFGGPV
jgi:hypothetical protein